MFWTYQVVVNTLVELPLGRAALPELLVSVVEAFPVLAEFGQAVCVDIREPVCPSKRQYPSFKYKSLVQLSASWT
jgi:hypothetical protein